jgi:raffinose/stachyose/melibiose transport system substrate-binding protein
VFSQAKKYVYAKAEYNSKRYCIIHCNYDDGKGTPIMNEKGDILKFRTDIEFIPKDGTYALPYAANAAGVLYNKDMFAENGWKVPTTWSEFTALCDEIKESGTLPLYLGFKDTWTCLAPWNALAVGLCDSDTCNQVNMGNTTFEEAYSPVADKIRTLLDYAEDNPYAYSYNDACTAFARGESAMYTIGSYAIPQIKSVNPDMNIGSFTFPANDNEADNVLNSGIDSQAKTSQRKMVGSPQCINSSKSLQVKK